MNKYGRMMLDHSRRFRPESLAEITDPVRFFTEAGEEAETAVAALRDQLLELAPPQSDPETLRLIGYQALRTAEEVVLADHPLLQGPTEDEEPEPVADPELVAYYQALAEIDEAMLETDEVLRGPTP